MSHMDQIWNMMVRDRAIGPERAMMRLLYDFQLHARFGTHIWQIWAPIAEEQIVEPYTTHID